jgi:hypothetical protein
MRALLCLFVLASAGCLRSTEFQCAGDSACGASGRCEITGFCSFADTECASGRRYDPSAGTLGGTCTSDGTTSDGGVDTSMPDDAASGTGCPAGYAALPGVPGHHYMVLTVAANWTSQHAACRATTLSAYLAIPDTIEELTAMDAHAGAAPYWVGINDRADEMVWQSVLGAAQTFLPWQPPAPDDDAGGQGEDCVEALPATHTINDVRCNQTRPAICECNPS